MQTEKFKIDFFKRKNNMPVERSVEMTEAEQKFLEKKLEADSKFKSNLLAVGCAVIGLAGIHFNIEYSGWLIFLGFLIRYKTN